MREKLESRANPHLLSREYLSESSELSSIFPIISVAAQAVQRQDFQRIIPFMGGRANIVICDESALFSHFHSDVSTSERAAHTSCNPLTSCAATAAHLTAFNTEHPLLGGEPVDALVTQRERRRNSEMVTTRLRNYSLPPDSPLKLRENLYVTSPDLAFARLGHGRSEVQIARIGAVRALLHRRRHKLDSESNGFSHSTCPVAQLSGNSSVHAWSLSSDSRDKMDASEQRIPAG